MRKKTIAVDVDGVLADFIGCVLGIYNGVQIDYLKPIRFVEEAYKKHVTYNDINIYDVEKIIGLDYWNKIMGIIDDNHLGLDFLIHDGALDGVNELRKLGKVVFVTAPYWPNTHWVNDRMAWLQSRFGASTNDVVFTSDKTNFKGDLLIDDAPHHLAMWTATGKPAIKIVRPWNKEYDCDFIANDWEHVIELSKKLLEENDC